MKDGQLFVLISYQKYMRHRLKVTFSKISEMQQKELYRGQTLSRCKYCINTHTHRALNGKGTNKGREDKISIEGFLKNTPIIGSLPCTLGHTSIEIGNTLHIATKSSGNATRYVTLPIFSRISKGPTNQGFNFPFWPNLITLFVGTTFRGTLSPTSTINYFIYDLYSFSILS